jgi:XTP/dITP diphosphohydrolase
VREFVLATRSVHKKREVLRILGRHPAIRLISLQDLDLPETAAEDNLENADSFLGNACAKAAYFARLTGRRTIAEDSGLEVDALSGQPGVHTRRFALLDGATNLSGAALDRANNELLIKRMQNVPRGQRSARYVCAAALVQPEGATRGAVGTCDGEIAIAPIGSGGFGYDPLFFLPDLQCTFAQLSADQKDERSHRAHAFHALAACVL